MGDLMIIVEYCPFGSLEKYTRRNQSYFIDQIDPRTKMINDSIGRQQHDIDDSAKEVAALKSKREGTQGQWVLKYIPDGSMVTGFGGTNSGLQRDSVTSNSGILASSSRNMTYPINPMLNENTTQQSLEESDRSSHFTTSNLVSWAYQIAQGMEYLASRKHYMEKSKLFEKRNAEYFRTKTDYLKMTRDNADDEYVPPSRKNYAFVEKDNFSTTHKYVNLENSMPEMTTRIQDDLQKGQEPPVRKENLRAYANIKDDPFSWNEQHQQSGSNKMKS
ncbi:unnamed protein product [Darwinula stevensoni]|uniref:Serine-threonine/tyrosine-protein kinase catalytic domain-containing protein n=1 Tax=Darwinula stevensoni TaxID=69355 RepID=A0A7R9A9A3_9CRUS|nr:unnamed protein product [Darwinula stevensoni]CAG0897217.1 unnamed protein product [Darwinula stevensoni]